MPSFDELAESRELSASMQIPNYELDSSKPLSTSSSTTSEREVVDRDFNPMDWEHEPEPRTLWDSARIQDSPTLTTLFEAFKIDEKIPLLPPPTIPLDYTQYISIAQLENKASAYDEEHVNEHENFVVLKAKRPIKPQKRNQTSIESSTFNSYKA